MLFLDINECEEKDENNCHVNADCFNKKGSFICQCQQGFFGDGKQCKRKQCATL